MAGTTLLPMLLIATVLCDAAMTLSSSPEIQADNCRVGKDDRDDNFCQPQCQSADGHKDSDHGE